MTVILKLDREREIRYNIKAVIEAETILGMPFQKIVNEEGYAVLRGLLWAGLRHEDRRLSVDQVTGFLDKLMEEERINEVLPAIQQALIEAKFILPDPNREGG